MIENKYADKILNLDESDKVVGIIYKMTNIITKKIYVGQTHSHMKNKEKYRPFGFIGRFKDHFSEAINNTKNSQSLCLNNSIRKHGKEAFTVELIETCLVDSLDERETYYIRKLNAMFPTGYNLKEGNHEFSKKPVENNEEPKEPKKRGREFGYKHKEETIGKMKKYYETADEKTLEKKKETMSNSISGHFSSKRAENLANSNIVLDENFADLIRPHYRDGELVSYTIRYKRKKYVQISGKKYTPEDIYNMLYSALKEAYEIRKKKEKKANKK